MDVTIYSIEYSKESPNDIDLWVSIGLDPMTRYRASFDDSDSRIRCCNVESKLFMALSEIAQARFGLCTVFQFELMEMISAFTKQELDLELPVKLGTTKYCQLKPTKLGVVYNKFRHYCTIFLWQIGFMRPIHLADPKQGNL